MKTRWGLKGLIALSLLISSVALNAAVIKSQTADVTDATNWVGGYRYQADNAGVLPEDSTGGVAPVHAISSDGTVISSTMTAGVIKATNAGIRTINFIISKDLYTDPGELSGDRFASFSGTENGSNKPHYLIAMQNNGSEDVYYILEQDTRLSTVNYEIKGDGTAKVTNTDKVGNPSFVSWQNLRGSQASGYLSFGDGNASPDFSATAQPIYYGFGRWTASKNATSLDSTSNSYNVSAMSLTVTEPSPQVYSSATCTQTNTVAYKGSADQEILGIEVVITGSEAPVYNNYIFILYNSSVVITGSEAPVYNLTGLELGTVGIDQVDNLKIYSTGTSSAFATTTLVHTINTPSGATQSISGLSVALAEGTNYFWVSYDVKSDAAIGTALDASCSQITVNNGTETTDNPTTSDPVGTVNVVSTLLSCGFEPADNFPESADSSPMPDTVDSSGNSWTFGENAQHWDGFASMPNNSQHLQFNPTTVDSFWQVTLATQPTEQLKGELTFDSTEGTTTTDIDIVVEGLNSGSWIQIGTVFDFTGISPYQTFTYQIGDISQFSAYRVRFINRDATSRVHFDNIRLTAVGASESQAYVSSTATQTATYSIVAREDMAGVEMMSIDIEMAGALNAESATEMSLNVTGANRISALKVYAGLIAIENELFSGLVNEGANTIDITDYLLANGVNTFVITYDIKDTTDAGDILDIACNSVTLSTTGSVTPSFTDNGDQITVYPALSVRSMKQASNYDQDIAIGSGATAVYFYGFDPEGDYVNADLDGNGAADWKGGPASTGGLVDASGIIRADQSDTLMRNLSFNDGNTAFSAEVYLQISGTSGGNYNASWAMFNNNSRNFTGSMFLIADDHIQLGDVVINTESNMDDFNYFRYSYEPSGSNDETGTIYIYRNGKPLGVFPNRNGKTASAKEWFGDSGSNFTGGYNVDYLSLTAGAVAQQENITPVVGIEVVQTNNILTWTVEQEIGVKEYLVINADTGQVILTVAAEDLGAYTVELPEGVSAKLQVVDESGYKQTFYPENGNMKTVNYNLEKGWNLIAVTSENADLSELKKVTTGELWVWDGVAYETTDVVKPTQGVWVYAPQKASATVTGSTSEAEMVLATGWNLTGPVENSMAPAEAVIIYSWSDIYQSIVTDQDVLLEGVGYWIFTF